MRPGKLVHYSGGMGHKIYFNVLFIYLVFIMLGLNSHSFTPKMINSSTQYAVLSRGDWHHFVFLLLIVSIQVMEDEQYDKENRTGQMGPVTPPPFPPLSCLCPLMTTFTFPRCLISFSSCSPLVQCG